MTINENRAKCVIDGCENLALRHHPRKDGSFSYRKLCTRHHKTKYGMSTVNSKKKRKFGKVLNMDRSFCVLCGWDKAPCDRHRIKYGVDGGKYEKGNVMSVCPNCHRLIHMGLLKIK